MKELYLDSNAHVPMSRAVTKVYADFQASKAGWGHPSAPSGPGQAAASALETARGKIATLLGAEKPSQIAFTSTCTQACEWGLSMLLSSWKGDRYWLWHSGMEHSAVKDWMDRQECYMPTLPVSSDGVISKPDKPCDYAVCVHVQNEIGTIQPLEELQADFLFSDMCQSPGKVSINLKDMPVDIAVFGAHKFGGPASVGFVYVKNHRIYREFGTGSRYFNDRPGTPDVGGVVATAAALEETLMAMPERLQKMKEFQTVLEDRLQDMDLEIIGKNASRAPNTTFVKMPGIAFSILAALSNKQIYVGMGSACGSMHTGPSPSMKTIGQTGDAHDFLRISQHGEYGKQEALFLADQLHNLLKQYKEKDVTDNR